MNATLIKLIVPVSIIATLVVAFWWWGNHCAEEQRLKDLAAPADTVIRIETTYTQPPTQFMEALADSIRGTLIPLTVRYYVKDTNDVVELRSALTLCNEEVGRLSKRANVELIDSLGGKHHIAYLPIAKRFLETYIPPYQPLITTTESITKYLPENESSLWGTLELTTEKRLGTSLGYKWFYAGGLFGKEVPEWKAGIKFNLF